jgi:hypothetical protein
MGYGGKAPQILYFNTRYETVIQLPIQPFYPQEKNPEDNPDTVAKRKMKPPNCPAYSELGHKHLVREVCMQYPGKGHVKGTDLGLARRK